MTWDHLSVTRAHLVYIILGGFTSLFMLCSSVIKERIYIGEATVATLCGIIFGPHAANLINPLDWGNTDLFTLEFSRIVLVVQCFAVGVELPRAYMEKHWRSVTFLLLPVMAFGWVATSLIVWWMFYSKLTWLESLCIAACVTATDPVLASSVVGKGKFSKRVPKHLRDLLSAESGCNDGMAFPFIYLALYIIRYRGSPGQIALHWFCYTVLYECIFGCVFGFVIGYAARRAIRFAHSHDMIDRESFLVFYFVLALFCAGSGSILGLDDLLVGFACGVGFSNDGWFQEKTEQSHVSNVIDLLLNLAFFVYFGTIIPWQQFNSHALGTHAWRLVIIALFVLFFRRIPIMVLLKPVIPDLKTWREALFAGHFGPIGVGALFVAILARAELETESPIPLDAEASEAESPHKKIIELIWPVTTFLVITSMIVHGSSIAVFTLGKRINTLSLTLTYTQGPDDHLNLKHRFSYGHNHNCAHHHHHHNRTYQHHHKNHMSSHRHGDIDYLNDKDERNYPDVSDDTSSYPCKGGGGRHPLRNRGFLSFRKNCRTLHGPISASAICPDRSRESLDISPAESDVQKVPGHNQNSDESNCSGEVESRALISPNSPPYISRVFKEGNHFIFEDIDGNVHATVEARGDTEEDQILNAQIDALEIFAKEADKRLVHYADSDVEKRDPVIASEYSKAGNDGSNEGSTSGINVAGQFPSRWQSIRSRMNNLIHVEATNKTRNRTGDAGGTGVLDAAEPVELGVSRQNSLSQKPKRGKAQAYQFGKTIIIEDEDGEVVKTYEIPVDSKVCEPSGKSMIRSGAVWAKDRFGHVGNLFRPAPNYQNEDINVSQNEAVGIASAPVAQLPDISGKKISSNGALRRPSGDDERLRFTAGGRKMDLEEFIETFRNLDPKLRAQVFESTCRSEDFKGIKFPSDFKLATDEKRRRSSVTNEHTSAPILSSDTGVSPTAITPKLHQQGNDSINEGHRLLDSRAATESSQRRLILNFSRRCSGQCNIHDETTAERRRRKEALGLTSSEELENSNKPGKRLS